MEEEKKKEIALFRFNIIHECVGSVRLEKGDQERIIKDKCARRWRIPFSDRTRVSRGMVFDWIKRYKASGGKLTSLYPKDRSDRGSSRAIDEFSGQNLIALKKSMPHLTVPRLIDMMHQRHLVSPGKVLKPTTVYRFLNHHDLMKPKATPQDRRKFESELPNDLWQSDVMHGPFVNGMGRKKKSYLIAFIDDHSRLIPYARFYLSENVASFLDAFEKALLRRGLPRKLYTDNGAAYRSRHLEHVTASLGIALIHAKPYQPQGKGKIERYFRTVRDQFLSGIKENLTLNELNDAFEHWLRNQYHQRVHSATRQSPLERFTSKMQCIRSTPKDLRDHFRVVAIRKVAKDRTVTLEGHLFEAPVSLIGQRVTLHFHKESPKKVEVFFKQQSYGFLVPVDLNINCRAKRDKKEGTRLSAQPSAHHKSGDIFNPTGGES